MSSISAEYREKMILAFAQRSYETFLKAAGPISYYGEHRPEWDSVPEDDKIGWMAIGTEMFEGIELQVSYIELLSETLNIFRPGRLKFS